MATQEQEATSALSLEGIKQTLARCLAGEDVMEGFTASMQKRAPEFKGN